MALKIEGVVVVNDSRDASLRDINISGAANAGSLVVNGNTAVVNLTINGAATASTAAMGTNTSQLATTAFVQGAVATAAQTNSPNFTGVPTAPTPAGTSNNTQLATTAFVRTISDLLAAKDSPNFTGTPLAPNAAIGASNTQIANTSFVQTAISSYAPSKSGTGAYGTWGISITGTADRANRITWSGIESRPDTIAGLVGDAKNAVPGDRVSSGFYENSATTVANGWPENGGWWHLLSNTHSNGSNYYAQQFASDFYSNKLFYRSTGGSGGTAWSRVVLSDGGVYPINIVGSAGSLGNIAAGEYALKASPALSGVPTTPTAPAGTNNAQIASTAFVQTSVSQATSDVRGGNIVIANPTSPRACDIRISGSDAQIYTGSKWEVFASGIGLHVYTQNASVNNVDFRTLAVQSGWDQSRRLHIIIPAGVVVGSTSTATPAATIAGSFPSGVMLTNNGRIIGAGGNGGTQGAWTGVDVMVPAPGGAGAGGGTALAVYSTLSITNNGVIGGGGGGGGGGGQTWLQSAAGGGGGGAGQVAGVGGAPNGSAGSSVPYPSGAGGAGGAGAPAIPGSTGSTVILNTVAGENGGAGGTLGSPGVSSSAGLGAGGAAGYSIYGFGNTTFVIRGTLLGPTA